MRKREREREKAMVFHSEGMTYTELKTKLFKLERSSGRQDIRLRGRMVSDSARNIRNSLIMQRNSDFLSNTTESH